MNTSMSDNDMSSENNRKRSQSDFYFFWNRDDHIRNHGFGKKWNFNTSTILFSVRNEGGAKKGTKLWFIG